MIAGETEYLLKLEAEDYDDFLKGFKLFGNKDKKKKAKKAKDPKLKEEKKEKRRQWWVRRKENLQEAGGIDGISQTIGNVFGFLKGDNSKGPSDFAINVGENKNNDPKENTIPKEVKYVAIGVVVLAGLYFLNKAANKKNAQQVQV